MSSLLPLNSVGLDEGGRSIWPHLLHAEAVALLCVSSTKYNDNVVGVRVLGFLLKDLRDHRDRSIGITPYRRVLLEVTLCLHVEGFAAGCRDEAEVQHQKLYELGLWYRNHLFRFCTYSSFPPDARIADGGLVQSNAGRIPSPSLHSSRSSFESHNDAIISSMNTAHKTGSDVKQEVGLYS